MKKIAFLNLLRIALSIVLFALSAVAFYFYLETSEAILLLVSGVVFVLMAIVNVVLRIEARQWMDMWDENTPTKEKEVI